MIKTPAAVKKYKQPKYPSRKEVLADPELLRKHVPRAWKACGEITAALAVFLAAAGSAQAQEKSEQTHPPAVPAQTTTTQETEQSGTVVTVQALATMHTRCNAVSITAGITQSASEPGSEETSLDVIKAALRSSGSRVKLKNVVGLQVSNKELLQAWFETNGKQEIRKPSFYVLGIGDAIDSKKRVVVKIVDFLEDEQSLHEKNPELLSGEAAKRPTTYMGVFEDAMTPVKCDESREERKQHRAEAKRMLRQQVADFVNWLKAQGAI